MEVGCGEDSKIDGIESVKRLSAFVSWAWYGAALAITVYELFLR